MKEKKLSTKSYKGTRDFYPEDMRLRNWIFAKMHSVVERYGYEEYDGPMLEPFDLYAAKTGEEIVNEQLYSFEDRGGRKMAIRPEMTPTLARMVAARIHELPKPIRWFSIPNLWRYERPQKGRLREHWQLNVDIFGIDSIDADIEIIEVAVDIMREFGTSEEQFRVLINNRRLMDYFFSDVLQLDEQQRYSVGKAIDKRSKVPPDVFNDMLLDTRMNTKQISSLHKFLNSSIEEIRETLNSENRGLRETVELFDGLAANSLSQYCDFDPSIMRGFDYYTGTVFEIYDTGQENRRSLYGGGRYDDLVGLFHNQRLSGIGFGMGDVTITDFLATYNLLPKLTTTVQVLVAIYDDATKQEAMNLARRLRQAQINTETYLMPDNFSKQFKYVNQKSIPYVAVLGPDELKRGIVTLKDMRKQIQNAYPLDEIDIHIKQLLEATE